MKPHPRFLLLLLLVALLTPLASADPLTADKPLPEPQGLAYINAGLHDKRLAGYRIPDGFRLDIVADAPTLLHPIALAFADDGTPHVIDWQPPDGQPARKEATRFTFKDGTTREVTVLRKTKKDAVKALTSSNKDGVFDKATVVLEADYPSALLLADGWLYLATDSGLQRHQRSKADGPYDVKQVLTRGFAGSPRQVAGLTLGRDGCLYFPVSAEDHIAEGSDGSRVDVLRSGAVLRCRADGAKLQVFAQGFRDPAGSPGFDISGNLFVVDGGEPCRLIHALEGADFGYRLQPGESDMLDPVRGCLHGELPGTLPPMHALEQGSAAGVFFYNDTRLPEEYRGLLLCADPTGKRVRAFRGEQTGSTCKLNEAFELIAAPGDEAFRPRQLVLGPDGAIYVVDERKADGKGGRIYRLSWSGTKEQPALPLRGLDSWGKIGRLKDAELLEVLGSDEESDRGKARQELGRRGDKNRAALIKLLHKADAALLPRYNALWALAALNDGPSRAALLRVMETDDGDLRRASADALALNAPRGDRDVQPVLLKYLSDEDRSVRRAMILAMGRLAGPGAADNLAASFTFDDGKDGGVRDAFARGLEMLGKEGIDALISVTDSGVQKDTNRVVELFLGLRTRPAFDMLPTLMNNIHVTSAQQAAMVRATVRYQLRPAGSLESMAAYVARQEKTTSEIKQALLDALATPGVSAGAKSSEYALAALEDGVDGVRVRAAAACGALRVSKAEPTLLAWVGDEKQSIAVRGAAVRALGDLGGKEAYKLVKDTLAGSAHGRIRGQALLALTRLDAKEGEAAAKTHLDGKDVDVQKAAVAVLAGKASGARYVGGLFVARKLPESLGGEVLEALRKHASQDAEAAKLAQVVRRRLATKD